MHSESFSALFQTKINLPKLYFLIYNPGTASVLNVDAVQEVQRAADVLEYALNLTSGTDKSNMVPIAVRHKLIKSQVLCKGLMKQPLPKNLGHDQDAVESQGPMTRALFSLEALSLKADRVAEFNPCPTIKEVWCNRELIISWC